MADVFLRSTTRPAAVRIRSGRWLARNGEVDLGRDLRDRSLEYGIWAGLDHAAAAIHALQTASRYDLALGRIGFVGRFGGLYPIYVRGLAYLAARQPAEAAVEFQRILDHRSIVLVDPVDAMARLQLARALALSGDTVKAKAAYDDLFALWKDADPGIPMGNQARAEYAKLQ